MRRTKMHTNLIKLHSGEKNKQLNEEDFTKVKAIEKNIIVCLSESQVPQVEGCFSQTKPTNWYLLWCRISTKQMKSEFFLPLWIKMLILCCFYKQGFHANQPHSKGTKGTASWEICIVNMFPRCLGCTLHAENYSISGPLPNFPLAGSDSFTTLNTWGEGSFLIVWRKSFLFLCSIWSGCS